MNAVDTNVLVYALSTGDAVKAARAEQLLDSLSRSDTVLLWQVACELGSVLSGLAREGKVQADVGEVLAAARARYPLALSGEGVLDRGWRIHKQHQVSYWDALLIAACAEAGVTRLYTEDMQGQPSIAGVEIVNPFV